jgi:acyl carrier protein
VKERLGVEKAEESDHLINDLGADSLDCVEIVMAIEEKFDIEIPDEDCEQIKTVEDIVSYIDKRAATVKNEAVVKFKKYGFVAIGGNEFTHKHIYGETFTIRNDTKVEELIREVFIKGRSRGVSDVKKAIKKL